MAYFIQNYFQVIQQIHNVPLYVNSLIGVTKNKTQFFPLSPVPNLVVGIGKIILKWHLINSTSKLDRIKERNPFISKAL